MKDLIWKLRVLRVLLGEAFDDWKKNIWAKDPDSYYCCNGRECCCQGSSIRENWDFSRLK